MQVVTATYPLIRARGKPEERGYMYGVGARQRIARTLKAYRALFAHYVEMPWSAVRQYAQRYESIICDYDPDLILEMRGIASGAQVDFLDILTVNVRTEVMYGLGELHAAECTAFAALPKATANGHTLLGQNWDWHPSAFECCVVLSLEQEAAPSILTVVEAGLLAKSGFNDSGVGVVTNALVSDVDRGEPGIPYHVILRAILNTSSFEEASGVVYEAQRSSSANYLIAARSGQAIDLETAPGDSDHVFALEANDGLLAHANCFISPDLNVADETIRLRPLGKARQGIMESHLDELRGEITSEQLKRVLSDHTNHPNSMCRHPLDHVAPMDRSATVASVIMNLDTLTMWVAGGEPCCHPYAEYRTSDLWS